MADKNNHNAGLSKHIKKQLVFSVLFILLTVAMYTVTAYTWYTVFVFNAGNAVRSGGYDYEAVYYIDKDIPRIMENDGIEETFTEENVFVQIENTGGEDRANLKYYFEINEDCDIIIEDITESESPILVVCEDGKTPETTLVKGEAHKYKITFIEEDNKNLNIRLKTTFENSNFYN